MTIATQTSFQGLGKGDFDGSDEKTLSLEMLEVQGSGFAGGLSSGCEEKEGEKHH